MTCSLHRKKKQNPARNSTIFRKKSELIKLQNLSVLLQTMKKKKFPTEVETSCFYSCASTANTFSVAVQNLTLLVSYWLRCIHYHALNCILKWLFCLECELHSSWVRVRQVSLTSEVPTSAEKEKLFSWPFFANFLFHGLSIPNCSSITKKYDQLNKTPSNFQHNTGVTKCGKKFQSNLKFEQVFNFFPEAAKNDSLFLLNKKP